MIFDNYINDSMRGTLKNGDINLYPVGEYNLDGIKILVENCVRMSSDNTNVEVATISPSIWLGAFLDKHWDKISFVCKGPRFSTLKIEDSKIIETQYSVESKHFSSDKELDDFFEDNKWKKFVLYYIVKMIDLRTMKITYNLRFSDITEKFEERDNKIKSVLD